MGLKGRGYLQLFCLFLIVIAGCLNFFITCFPEWRRNDPQGDLIETIVRTQGLWMSCISYPTGNFACEDFDRFFIALDSAIIGSRALCILACVLWLFALCCGIAGSSCTMVMTNGIKKNRTMVIGGILSIMAGACVIIACSWYFARVLDSYFTYGQFSAVTGVTAGSFGTAERYVGGFCIYLGWVAGAIGVAAGFMMCCCARDKYEDQEFYDQDYDNAYVPNTMTNTNSYGPDAYNQHQGTNNFSTLPTKPAYDNMAYVPPVENRNRTTYPFENNQSTSNNNRPYEIDVPRKTNNQSNNIRVTTGQTQVNCTRTRNNQRSGEQDVPDPKNKSWV